MTSPENAWYKGNDNPNDSGSNGLNLVPESTVAYAAGKLSNAFLFDGTVNSRLAHATNALYNLGSEFSVSYWVKTTTSNYHTAVSRYVDGVGGWYARSIKTSGHLFWYHHPDIAIEGAVNVADGNWHLIIIQREADGKTHFYIDNVEDGAGTADATTYTEAYPFFVGIRDGIYWQMGDDDLIDDIRIFTSNSLTAGERSTLWNSGAGTPNSLAAAATNMKLNIGDVFKDVASVKINIGDTWKDVTKVQVNIGDTWKTVFG